MPFPFEAELGVMGDLDGSTPRHLKLGFEACFYALPDGPMTALQPLRSFSSSYAGAGSAGALLSSSKPSSTATSLSPAVSASAAATQAPYVGTVDLEGHYRLALEATIASQGASIPPKLPGYAVPRRGHIQLLIKNPHLNIPVKLFLVPYDLRDMPAGTKTFIRQKTVLDCLDQDSKRSKRHSMSGSTILADNSTQCKETLRYAIHLQFAALPSTRGKRKARKSAYSVAPLHRATSPQWSQTSLIDSSFDACAYKMSASLRDQVGSTSCDDTSFAFSAVDEGDEAPQIFLHKSIRVVFSPRAPDKEEVVRTYSETPAGLTLSSCDDHVAAAKERQKKYVSYGGPSEEWDNRKRQARQLRNEWRQRQATHVAVSNASHQGPELVPSTPFKALPVSARDIPTTCAINIPPREAFAPNSDPNGERWVEEGESGATAPIPARDVPIEDLQYRWRGFAARESDNAEGTMRIASSFTPLVLGFWQARRPRSRVLTPDLPRAVNEEERTQPTNMGGRRPKASSMSLRLSRLSAGLDNGVKPSSSSSRPSSPFTPALVVSTALLPIMTNETASGVTSPPLLLSSSPMEHPSGHVTATSPQALIAKGSFSFFHKRRPTSPSLALVRDRSHSLGWRDEESRTASSGDRLKRVQASLPLSPL